MAGAEHVSMKTGAKYTIKGVGKQGDQPLLVTFFNQVPRRSQPILASSNIKAAGIVAVLRTWC